MREWRTDEQVEADRRGARSLVLEAWAIALLLGAVTVVGAWMGIAH